MSNFEELHFSDGMVLSIEPVSWAQLAPFLCEQLLLSQDVDKDVLRLREEHLYQQCTEGFFVNGELVGYARHNAMRLHLSQIYLCPIIRRRGIARYYIESRKVQGLWVMGENTTAITLYGSMGFGYIGHTYNRLYLSRLPNHLAIMPA